MRMFKFWLPFMLGLAAASAASAQIYESKDAQGNTVFSDKPSAGAEVVKVAPTNSADPVEEAAERPQPAKSPAAPGRSSGSSTAPGQREEDDYEPIYYGGGAVNNEEAQQRQEEAKERREEGAGKPDREPPARVETLPAARRPAVGGGRR